MSDSRQTALVLSHMQPLGDEVAAIAVGTSSYMLTTCI